VNRALIYLFPALIDLVVATLQFVSSARAPKLGADAIGTGAVLMIWSLFYLSTCYLLGKRVTVENAPRLLQISCFILTGLSATFLTTSSLAVIYLLMAGTGIATAFFFVPFQIFMKAVDEDDARALTFTTACYTLAWSTGYALAPLVAGYLMMLGPPSPSGEALGWKYCDLFSCAICLGTAAGLRLVKGRSLSPPKTQMPGKTELIPYEKMPNYAWLAWTMGGVGILAYSALRSIFQEYAYQLSLSDALKGTILFVLSMTQALVGFSFLHSRLWMYRWRPLFALGLCGLAGMACFGWGKGPAAFLLGAGLYGTYSGGLFFYFTFHALTHAAVRSRHVAMNEIVFGSTALMGPLLGGFLADHISPSFPYLCFGFLLLPCLIFQAVIHFRDRARVDSVARIGQVAPHGCN
jgi:MFS family permease